ncbi:MAG: hypothetical protein WD046_02860, partial [Paracoccaceae bacterium]
MALCPAPDPKRRAPNTDGLIPLAAALPDWIPDMAETYLRHVDCGIPLRRIAQAKGVHASTVLRQVRKLELRRDDPLMDEALSHIAHVYFSVPTPQAKEASLMQSSNLKPAEDSQIKREARRILRRLCEKDAYLLVAPHLDMPAVFRDLPDGARRRIATVKRDVARAFVLQDWIEGSAVGTLTRYKITAVGRAALKRLLAKDAPDGGFQDQHRVYGERDVMEADNLKVFRCGPQHDVGGHDLA